MSNPGQAAVDGWWSFNNSALDETDNNLDGTLQGDASYEATTKKVGSHSLDLDGTGDYVGFGNVLDKTGGAAFSVMAWCYGRTGFDADYVCKRVSTGQQQGYSVFFSPKAGFQLRNSSGGRILRWSTTEHSADTWYHAITTYDGGGSKAGVKIYVNGSEVTYDTGTEVDTFSGSASNTHDFEIGRRDGGGEWDGFLDEVVMFNLELSSANVTWLYNSGSGRAYGDLAAGGGLSIPVAMNSYRQRRQFSLG